MASCRDARGFIGRELLKPSTKAFEEAIDSGSGQVRHFEVVGSY
jgi:hypothetical protein